MKRKPVPLSVHKDNCQYCPSARGSDPESEMYAALPEGERQLYVFPCAWRPEKLCKGVCEEMGYTEEKHGNLLFNRDT